jgi:hypothetical protein
MKKMIVLMAAALAFSAPMAVLAMEGMDMDHGSMKMEHGSMSAMGKVVKEEVVDGVKGTFMVKDIQAAMAKMGMKETNHIMTVFTNAKTHQKMSKGEVKMKVIAPDKKEQVKDLVAMEGGFGADFTMPAKGKYGVIAKTKLDDGKIRVYKFWYTVK